MSYTKLMKYADLTVEIVYKYAYNNIKLEHWTAFKNNVEHLVPCSVVSKAIEIKAQQVLQKELDENYTNYEEDFLDSLAEARYPLTTEVK